MSIVYKVITERIIQKLQQGVAPWRKGWQMKADGQYGAINWATGRAYQGINLLLTDPEGQYATKKQIEKAGGRIKRGEEENATIVCFYVDAHRKRKKEEEEDDSTEQNNEQTTKILKPLYYRVYDVLTQVDGLQPRERGEAIAFTPVERLTACETLVSGYRSAPEIRHRSNRAFYTPVLDRVSVPPIEEFHSPEEYYATLFHELIHSTGHESRLARPFGERMTDERYSREELVAEMGAAMLCAVAGIEDAVLDNSASYLNSWIGVLKGDEKLIFRAAAAAQRAADYIRGKENAEQASA